MKANYIVRFHGKQIEARFQDRNGGMDMITREMIQNGFDNGSISIEDEFGGCISLCCRIADNAFYFAGMEDGDLTAEEFLKSYTMNEIIDMLYGILKDVESAEENGIDSMELDYYESVLS